MALGRRAGLRPYKKRPPWGGVASLGALMKCRCCASKMVSGRADRPSRRIDLSTRACLDATV